MLFVWLEARSQFVAQAGFEPEMVHLSQYLQVWDDKSELLHVSDFRLCK